MILLKNALYLSWADTKARYKKSVLGPLWLTFGNLVGVLGLSLVWAQLLKEDMHSFVPSLTIGMIVWQLIAGAITEGPVTFIRQSNMIRNVAIPPWFFVVRMLSRQVINLLHNLLIVVGVVLYFGFELKPSVVWVLPGLLLVLLNLLWIMFLLGLLGARFRDVEFLINALLPLLFFISPVIFRPDRLPVDLNIIWLNPLSYFIEIVRAPFLGQEPSGLNFAVVGLALLAGSVLTWLVYRAKGRQLAFWV